MQTKNKKIKTVTVACAECGNPKEILESRYRARMAWGAKNFFCSNPCSMKFQERNYVFHIR